MYCSTCGVAVAKGLSFCNYCGAELIGSKGNSGSPEVRPELLVSAMAGVFILGLGAIAVLIGILKQVAAFDMPILLAITMFSFMLMIIIESVLIGLLLRRRKGTKELKAADRQKDHTTKELLDAQARMLQEPVASVTEHTTRAFAPVYTEPKTK
jgi:hypothetical protein